MEDKERSEDEPGARVMLFTKTESTRRRRGYPERHQQPPCKCVVWVPVGSQAAVPWAAGRLGLSMPRGGQQRDVSGEGEVAGEWGEEDRGEGPGPGAEGHRR